MKANEAPEKLYLHPTAKGNVGASWLTFPLTNEDVEYARTDAFIKKAVSYLNSKLYDWVQTTNPNQRSYANTIMKEEFIEDFRNYLKGE